MYMHVCVHIYKRTFVSPSRSISGSFLPQCASSCTNGQFL